MLVFLMLYLCLLIAQEVITLAEEPVEGQRLENPSPEYTTTMKIFGAPDICINPKKIAKTKAKLNSLKVCCKEFIDEQLKFQNKNLSDEQTLIICAHSSIITKKCKPVSSYLKKPHGISTVSSSKQKIVLRCANSDDKFNAFNKNEVTLYCVGDKWIYTNDDNENYILSEKTLNSLKCEIPKKEPVSGSCEASQIELNSICKVTENSVEKEFICKEKGWVSITKNGFDGFLYTPQMKEFGAPTVCIYPEESVKSQESIDSLKTCCQKYIKEHLRDITIEQIKKNLSDCVNNVISTVTVSNDDFRQCEEIADGSTGHEFIVEKEGRKSKLICSSGMKLNYFNKEVITLQCVGKKWVDLTQNPKFYVMSDEKVKSLKCETIEQEIEDTACDSNLVLEDAVCEDKEKTKKVCKNKIWEDFTEVVVTDDPQGTKPENPTGNENTEEPPRIVSTKEPNTGNGGSEGTGAIDPGTEVKQKIPVTEDMDTKEVEEEEDQPETQITGVDGSKPPVTEDNSKNAPNNGNDTPVDSQPDGTQTSIPSTENGGSENLGASNTIVIQKIPVTEDMDTKEVEEEEDQPETQITGVDGSKPPVAEDNSKSNPKDKNPPGNEKTGGSISPGTNGPGAGVKPSIPKNPGTGEIPKGNPKDNEAGDKPKGNPKDNEAGDKPKSNPEDEGTKTEVTEEETDGYSSVCPVVLITLFSMML